MNSLKKSFPAVLPACAFLLNVIFLLNRGQPQSMKMAANAGRTDLLVTWLYKMTVTDTNYKMAAVIGIMVFLVTAVISLVVYNILPSVKDEEGFQ